MQKETIVYAVILVILSACSLYLMRSFGLRLAAATIAAVLLAVAVLTLILDRLL